MASYNYSISCDGNKNIVRNYRQETVNRLDQFVQLSKNQGRYGDLKSYLKSQAFDITKIALQKGISTLAGEAIGSYVGPTFDYLKDKVTNKYIYGDENCENYANQLERNIQIININDLVGLNDTPRYVGINTNGQVIFESMDIKEMHTDLVTYAIANRLLKEGDFIQNLSPFVFEIENSDKGSSFKVIRFQNGHQISDEKDPDFITYQQGKDALNAKTMMNQKTRKKQIHKFINLIARNSSIIKDPTQETFVSKPLPQSRTDSPELSLPMDSDLGDHLNDDWVDLGTNGPAAPNTQYLQMPSSSSSSSSSSYYVSDEDE